MAQAQPNSPDIEKWLQLLRSDNVGPATFQKLIKHFETAENALDASVSSMTEIDGIGFKTAERIASSRDKFDVSSELKLADKLGIWLINLNDQRYPPALKRIYDPPPVLYIKGTLKDSDNLCIAIVGTRRCSLYGREQSSRFAHLLSSSGFTIASGMARGIDTAAHHGALSAAGRTIAVQGCGLAHIFPPENKKLFELISESGACISELPLNYQPLSENFPSRNRIIAGLSLATIVIEADLYSGALITATSALENNREVMAIPGKIDSDLNRGTHKLIKQGARLLDSVEDVMDSLGYIGRGLYEHAADASAAASEQADAPLFDASRLNLTGHEKAIYESLTKEPMHIEQLIARLSAPAGSVNSALITLQLKGLVKQLPGNLFLKR